MYKQFYAVEAGEKVWGYVSATVTIEVGNCWKYVARLGARVANMAKTYLECESYRARGVLVVAKISSLDYEGNWVIQTGTEDVSLYYSCEYTSRV